MPRPNRHLAPSRSSLSGRNPKSSIRKRKLPDREQIEYFRLGFSSLVNVQKFQDQFLDFWTGLPPAFREDDEDDLIPGTNSKTNAAQMEQYYALNEDDFKHHIEELPGHLATTDLIVPPPHCLIRQKIGIAVNHYQQMNRTKQEPDSLIERDCSVMMDDEMNISSLSLTPSPRKKRRMLRSNGSGTSSSSSKRKSRKRCGDDDFVVDDDEESESLCSDDLNLENELFDIKLEPEPGPDAVVDLDTAESATSSPKLRRSKRRRNKKANYKDGDDEDEDIEIEEKDVVAVPSTIPPVDGVRDHALNGNDEVHSVIEVEAVSTTTAIAANGANSVDLQFQNEQNGENENGSNAVNTSSTPSMDNAVSNASIPMDNDAPILRGARGAPSSPRSANKGRKRKRRSSGNSERSGRSQSTKNQRVRCQGKNRANDRPHVLFAANVQMPYYNQLTAPFEHYQSKRKQFKQSNSKKEVNSMTKLCQNHRIQHIEQSKGRRHLRENEVLLRVAIFHGSYSSERYTKSHEYLVMSSQKLSDLKDTFYCLMDQTPIAKEVRNSYFFIEDTFYDDMRHDDAIRLSDNIVHWSRCDEHWKQTGVYQQRNMEEVKLSDLDIRLGSHYLWVHQGDCHHVIVFTDCRVCTKWDCPNQYVYPICTYRQILKRQKCGVCEMYPAKMVTYGDKLTTHNPFFFCERCYHSLHYDKDGKHLYTDYQVWDYVHD